ncbi:MAG: hypothetical protein R3F54_23950 [Alphaproteobacteria bacterium]
MAIGARKAGDGIRRWRRALHWASAILFTVILPSCLTTTESTERNSAAGSARVMWPSGDAQAGKDLFVEKGCVICHSVNDVGGRAALPLDAPPAGRSVDPMVFAAAMWQGAAAMLSLQFTELGYQIGMTGEELRDLAAFASDRDGQASFSVEDIPEDISPWIIDEPYWLDDDWPEPFKTVPDGTASPFEDL